VELLPADARPWERADHLLGLADALGEVGSYEQALRRYDEAGVIAQRTEDVRQWQHILNNVAYTHFQAGNAQEAVATAERLISVSERHGIELDIYDRDTIARAYTMVDRHADAVAVLAPVLGADAVPVSAPVFDGIASAMVTLAEIQRLAGALDDAQSTIERATAICAAHDLTGVANELHREQAEIHAARGDFQRAFATYKLFHEADARLRAIERETRARTLQVLYEADEARRDSDHFRELSVRDPLTGLRNRRYVDEHLGVQLLHAVDTSTCLTLAILDLDHFKRVNDERSHDVGDRVLREVASLLERAIDGQAGATAARLGGEEFLLVLQGTDQGTGEKLVSTLCRDIREHPWEAVTGGIPVTVSIGVATVPEDGIDRTPLLRCADRRLYAAKRAGRDQVVARDRSDAGLEPVG
jgi:diguanylate cyclase (GGDEF)-like protein